MGDLDITGARVLYYNEALGGAVLTQAVVNMWICMAIIAGLCIFLTRGLKVHATTKRQHVAEYAVKWITGMVTENMGPKWAGFAPFIGAILFLSVTCSLSPLVFNVVAIFLPGISFAPTQDLSVLLGWALVVFLMITYWKIRVNHIGGYLKGYLQPIPVLLPINIISELATPISMAFRHFGNIASGAVITTLLYGAFSALSSMVLGTLPGAIGSLLGQIPILQIGIPAVLSIYFDFFSSCIQAYIFCMLTMMYVSAAATAD